MLFNSYEFLFLFLPLTLLGFFRIAKLDRPRLALGWLVAASLVFYGWWNPAYLALLLTLLAVNYGIGLLLRVRRSGWLLALGVGANLAVLGYYKYTDFLLQNLNAAFGTALPLEHIVLPLGISFMVFQKIAFLVDTWRGDTPRYGFLEYSLFVVFFPQLIAGPIVHHSRIIPQFAEGRFLRFDRTAFAVGLTILTIGLTKKVLVADNLAPIADQAFDALHGAAPLTLFEAWRGALAYSFQLYFDFSGYSDIAIGLAALFGIALPLNFHSPYKATGIIDFWRRWHMTLSQFLRDYVYIALGGSRRGKLRRHANLFATMLLGGLWHGAAWTFVLWGALHGLFLMVNHGWRALAAGRVRLPAWLARVLTFLCVALAWVVFRAPDLDGALTMLRSMAGSAGVLWPHGDVAAPLAQLLGAGIGDPRQFEGTQDLLVLALLLAAVWRLPNTQEIMGAFHPAAGETGATAALWRPSRGFALTMGIAAALVVLQLSRVSRFLYFQF